MAQDNKRVMREWLGRIDWQEFFETSNGTPGGVDILCIGASRSAERLGELLSMLLMVLMDKSGGPAYRFITVIGAPLNGTEELDWMYHLSAAVNQIRGSELDADERAAASKRVKIIHSGDLQCASVAAIVKATLPRSFVVVLDSALYRDGGAAALRVSRTQLEEDTWVPHLVSLASACIDAVRDRQSCVLLDTGEYQPLRDDNLQKLKSLEHAALLVYRRDDDPSALLAEHADEWVAQVRAGRANVALAKIDSLPSVFDPHKPAIKIQMLHNGGESHGATGLIRREFQAGKVFNAHTTLRFASIALDGEDPGLARTLLEQSIPALTAQELLEEALVLCRKLKLTALEVQCRKLLSSMYPQSRGLHNHRIIRLLDACRKSLPDNSAAADPGQSDFRDFAKTVLDSSCIEPTPDYRTLLQQWQDRWPQFRREALLCCASNAEVRGLPTEVLMFARPSDWDGDFAFYASKMLLRAMEVELLSRRAELQDQADKLIPALLEVFGYLAKNPRDMECRCSLARLMSVQVAGLVGIALLARAVGLLAEHGHLLSTEDIPAVPEAADDEFKRFFVAALDFLEQCGPAPIGSVTLPRTMCGASPDALFDYVVEMADRVISIHDGDDDLHFLEQLVAVACALAPNCSRPEDDLVLLRVAAGKQVTAGQMQKGRDWAEHALTMAKGDALRARLAWFTFTDIYQRCRNYVEALIGMGAALSTKTEVTVQQAFYETYGLIRLFRDLGLVDLASNCFPACRMLLERSGQSEMAAHRLETIRLGIETRRLTRTAAPPDPDSVNRLVIEAAANLGAVLARRDEIMPVVALATQLFDLADDLNVPVNADARNMLVRAQETIGERGAALMRMVVQKAPSAAEVLQWINLSEAARYSEDVAYDMHLLERAASKLLASAEAAGNAHVAAFAAELKADHGVSFPQGARAEEKDRPQWLPGSVEEPGRLATDISGRGIQVSLLALDEAKHLVRITAQDGVLRDTVYEVDATFSEARFQDWSKEFPYGYANARENVGDLFYSSMRGLGLTAPASDRLVLVLDTMLQQMPPNLLLVNDQFIGRVTRMAVAPSVVWLHAAIAAPPRRQGSTVAWISTAANDGSKGTLGVLAERLDETLAKNGIRLHTSEDVPDELENAELAIIGAHGGIATEGRYFQVVADEDALKMSSVALSTSLRNAGVTVLFVCSGGRFDKHPLANTVIGLPKELLDRGNRAVIASPWPLDVRVPSHWLPAFLAAWNSGKPLIDANFEANRAVELAMGDSPEYCMAMTLYGNPLLVRQAENI